MINFGARHILVAGSALVALALAARTGLAADSWRSQSLRDKTVTGPNGSVTTAGADARQAEEELTKADRRQSQQVVRSPADGLVQQLAVYSEGAVLKAADPILVVVPDKGELIVEAQVLNRDAGFVEEAQKDEEGRGPEAGLGIGGKHADEGRGATHQADGDEEGVFAADPVAIMAEHHCADGPHAKAGAEGGEAGERGGGGIVDREEELADEGGEDAVEEEIIPFEHGAQRRGDDDQAVALDVDRLVGVLWLHLR
jgi:hypothetical protein